MHSIISLPAGSFTSAGTIPTKVLFFEKKGNTKKFGFARLKVNSQKANDQKEDFSSSRKIFNEKKLGYMFMDKKYR